MYIFSDDNKFRTWRRLWVALARAEMEQGLTNITPEMVAELEAHVDDINYEVAIAREKLVRHDVMSHVYAYGQQCPKAAGIIHLGATSCYVSSNMQDWGKRYPHAGYGGSFRHWLRENNPKPYGS